jgi:hypothetical protein
VTTLTPARRIERVAVERGCAHAHLDTFSYQARPFDERLGSRVLAVLEEDPSGQQRFFMRTVSRRAGHRSWVSGARLARPRGGCG